MDLSIVIVTYKAKDFIDACIKSVYENTSKIEFEIILVDNHSNDGCVEMIKLKYPDVKTITNRMNFGFAKAGNIGIRVASGRYVLLLDPDTVVRDRALEKMVEFMEENQEIGIAGCRVENSDGSLQKSCRRNIPTIKSAFYSVIGLGRFLPENRRLNPSNTHDGGRIEIDAISSAFFMIRGDVIEEIGGMDEDYFLYAEDLDYCYKAKKKGWRIVYYPGARITHYKRQSSRHLSLKATKDYYDSMAIFFKKNLERRTFFLVRLVIYPTIWLVKQVAILRLMRSKGNVPGPRDWK